MGFNSAFKGLKAETFPKPHITPERHRASSSHRKITCDVLGVTCKKHEPLCTLTLFRLNSDS